MKEIWKDIEGYEGLYQVSNLGTVTSLDREVIQFNRFKNIKRIYKGKNLSKKITNRGYLSVALTKNGISKYFLIHRLVAKTFLQNFEENMTIDHIDCNKLNNNVENLRIVTLKKNIQLSYENKLHNLKKVRQLDLNGNLLNIYDSVASASKTLQCSYQLIKNCCDKKPHCLTGKGFLWEYEV